MVAANVLKVSELPSRVAADAFKNLCDSVVPFVFS